MDPITLKIIIGVSVVVWLFICLIIYQSSRTAAWLAGSTVASCLFFLGTTVAASLLVKRALFLAPLWLGVLFLSLLHIGAARHESSPTGPDSDGGRQQMTSTPSHSTEGSSEGVYI